LSQHHRISPLRLIGECILAVVTGCVLAFLVHWLFGEEFATRQQARVYAPIAGANYGNGKKGDIRVVLIDDAALAKAEQVWPAQYSYSARLLSAIAQYKPKAIFVDIYYGAARDDASLPALTRALCKIRQQGVPVFLAAARDGAGNYPLRTEIDALAGTCFDKVAIQYAPDDIDRLAWSYQLEVHPPGHGAHAAPPLKSAALALYEVGGHHLEVDHHPLALTWGSSAASNGIGWLKDGASKKSYCRPSHGWGELLPPGVRNSLWHDTDEPLCVFHETLSALAFAQTSVEDDARLRGDIAGKTVLVGLANTDSADFVLSPLHGRIPGIYLHAMALDNLEVAANDYARQMHLGIGREYGVMILFLLTSMLVVTLLPKLVVPWIGARFGLQAVNEPVTYLADKLHLRLPDGYWQVGVLFLYIAVAVVRLLLVLAVGCAMVYAGQHLFGLGFLSVISVIFITLTAEWFEVNEKISEHLFSRSAPHAASHAAQTAPTTTHPVESAHETP
jgi:CHASE2 domain-containing sensor protein